MMRGVAIRVVYFDADIYELRITATNGDFSGSVCLYVAIGQLGELADELSGFPRTSTDEREIELGTFERGYAGGGVRASFRCIDGAGHIQMRVRTETDHNQDAPAQSVMLFLPIEPASIDKFVEELHALEDSRTGEAALCSHN
ncbi:MAG TPA: hypothetical protein VGN01_10215 [Acidobacteriaceae bacterium]|jgi:hypothetical protein